MQRIARSIIFLCLGYASACGGKDNPMKADPPTDPTPHITSISPDPIVEGQTATLTGTDFSPTASLNTVAMDDVTLVVTAASETSLTVTMPEGCGPLRTTNLTVTVGGRASDLFSATVAPDPAGPALQSVSLAVGDQVVYRQPRYCLDLPTNGTAAQYLLGIQSTGRDGNATREITVDGIATGSVLAPRPEGAAARAAASGTGLPTGLYGQNPASALLRRHRVGHDALMTDLIRPVRGAAGGLGGLSAQRAPSRVVVNGTEMVGDSVELRVRRLGASDCSAASTITVTAELRVKTAGSMWWVDVDNPPVPLLDDSLQALSVLFDDQILATENAEFGAATDIDENGRITILITQAINADTMSVGQALGFVNPCDFFDRDDASGFVATNEGEFFYSIAPDPSGTSGEVLSVGDWMNVMPIIIAHEFTHIIQTSRRAVSTNFMDPFVAEGQATLAEEVVGHAMLGNGAGQNLGGNVAFNFPPEDQANPWYFAAFADLVFYFGFPGSADDPRVEGTPQECTWIEDDVEDPCGGRPLWYGVTWSFLRWASDLYGPALGGEDVFQKALIDGDLSGFDNLEEALAGQGTLDDHLANWAATLYMDGRPGASPNNSMSTWNLLDVSQQVAEAAWLHPVEHGFINFSETVTVRDPSTSYFLVGGSGAPNHSLRITTTSGAALDSDVQVWLVRTQ